MSDVLDLIDRAICDHETSADAMRWSPDPPCPDEPSTTGQGANVFVAPAGTFGSALASGWTDLGWCTEDGLTYEVEADATIGRGGSGDRQGSGARA